MTYRNWTLGMVREAFHLEELDFQGIFADIEPVEPSADLAKALAKKTPLAFAIGTEKAKSELIVADILVELCEHFDYRVSLFSGIDFTVDAANDLNGVCDFLISLSPAQFSMEAPVIVLVEAKRDNLTDRLGQCAAEMVAAQRFNAEEGNDIPRVYGGITSGLNWLFLKLEGQQLHIDMNAYQLSQCDKVLGILASMVEQTA